MGLLLRGFFCLSGLTSPRGLQDNSPCSGTCSGADPAAHSVAVAGPAIWVADGACFLGAYLRASQAPVAERNSTRACRTAASSAAWRRSSSPRRSCSALHARGSAATVPPLPPAPEPALPAPEPALPARAAPPTPAPDSPPWAAGGPGNARRRARSCGSAESSRPALRHRACAARRRSACVVWRTISVSSRRSASKYCQRPSILSRQSAATRT
mmetsp:Transcript_34332/g.94860  ORF Transcript_34332/g.94860 Transcript_34332/m.94860 type:complete len:213 (+) Transcript_34332:304-942(+)